MWYNISWCLNVNSEATWVTLTLSNIRSILGDKHSWEIQRDVCRRGPAEGWQGKVYVFNIVSTLIRWKFCQPIMWNIIKWNFNVLRRAKPKTANITRHFHFSSWTVMWKKIEFINFSPSCCVITIYYNLCYAASFTANEMMSESQGVGRE